MIVINYYATITHRMIRVVPVIGLQCFIRTCDRFTDYSDYNL